MANPESDAVLRPVRSVFRALAMTIVPEASRLGEDEWADLERIVEYALSRRPARMRRQLVLFIRVLSFLPLLRWGRTFRGLDDARRARFLHAVERSRVLLVRRGMWGLRTMVFMGYYARPEAAAEIGYRADPRGWEAVR